MSYCRTKEEYIAEAKKSVVYDKQGRLLDDNQMAERSDIIKSMIVAQALYGRPINNDTAQESLEKIRRSVYE